MNRVVSLVETPLLRITRFEHPEGEPHHDPREENATSISLSFVLRGSFLIRAGSKELELTPRTVFATFPGLAYRTLHTDDRPTDVCLSVDYAPGFFGEDCLALGAPVIPLTNRSAYARWRLERALSERRGPVAFEELGAELLSATMDHEPTTRLFRERSLFWYAERVDRARHLMEASYQEEHSLGSLSRAVGMSPFHFARLFRELVGVPPVKYLLFTRLERARKLLREGRPVTATAFDCGFRNLSYFTRAFRKRYRSAPSAVLLSRRN